MRILSGFLFVAAFGATSALAVESAPATVAPGTAAFPLALQCDGSGIKDISIRATSRRGGGSLFRAHVELSGGETATFSVRRILPPVGSNGGSTTYRGTDFELRISFTAAPGPDGRHVGSFEAKVSGKKLDQSVSCDR